MSPNEERATKNTAEPTRNTPESIRAEVRKHYAAIVTERDPQSGCGCGGEAKAVRQPKPAAASSCCGGGPEPSSQSIEPGYGAEDLKGIPQAAVESSLGCGNPLAFAGVREGETVLDIGSGAGIDCFIAARKVGPSGRVIGVDMTPEMLDRAQKNARQGGYTNVEFLQGEAEALPVPDSSVDWIISNCVINLSPDKPRVFSEIARVLRPGGRFAISDIVTAAALPEAVVKDLAAWAGCIAGAVSEQEFVDGLRKAGLKDVEVTERIVYGEEAINEVLGCCSSGMSGASGTSGAAVPSSTGSPGAAGSSCCGTVSSGMVKDFAGKVWSARITGRK